MLLVAKFLIDRKYFYYLEQNKSEREVSLLFSSDKKSLRSRRARRIFYVSLTFRADTHKSGAMLHSFNVCWFLGLDIFIERLERGVIILGIEDMQIVKVCSSMVFCIVFKLIRKRLSSIYISTKISLPFKK